MTVELRPYQKEAVKAAHDANERGVQKLAVGLPTGTGKTLVFSQLAQERGYPTLILAHRDELIQQAVSKYQMVDSSVPIGIVKAGLHQADLPVVVASVQTLARAARLNKMPTDFKTVIVDEGHHATADSYVRILDFFQDVDMHSFFSATLERSDRRALSAVIDEVVYHKSILDMIHQGYLVDIRAFGVRVPNFRVNQLKIVRGDFKGSDVEEALKAAGAYRVAVKAWQEYGEERKTLIFAPGVESAMEFSAAFNAAGIPSTYIIGALDTDERRQRLLDFQNDKYTILCNNLVLTEGYDEPSIQCIINARPTRSKPLYIQMVGRGTRLYPGKPDLLVLDLVGNEERHDIVSVPKLFGVKAGTLKEKGLSAANLEKELEPERLAHIRAGLANMDDIALRAEEANLFDRKKINWLPLANGSWVLSGAKGALHLDNRGENKWDATLHPYDKSIPVRMVAEGYDLGMAMGIAEDQIVRPTLSRTRSLIDPTAPWRKGSPSDKQLEIMRDKRIPIPNGLTKGQASDLISAAMATTRRHARAR